PQSKERGLVVRQPRIGDSLFSDLQLSRPELDVRWLIHHECIRQGHRRRLPDTGRLILQHELRPRFHGFIWSEHTITADRADTGRYRRPVSGAQAERTGVRDLDLEVDEVRWNR